MRVGLISGSCCRVDFHRCLIASLTQPGKADYLQELKQLFLALKLGDVIQFVTGSAEFTQIYLVSDVVASFVSTQKEPEKQAKKFKKREKERDSFADEGRPKKRDLSATRFLGQ